MWYNSLSYLSKVLRIYEKKKLEEAVKLENKIYSDKLPNKTIKGKLYK